MWSYLLTFSVALIISSHTVLSIVFINSNCPCELLQELMPCAPSQPVQCPSYQAPVAQVPCPAPIACHGDAVPLYTPPIEQLPSSINYYEDAAEATLVESTPQLIQVVDNGNVDNGYADISSQISYLLQPIINSNGRSLTIPLASPSSNKHIQQTETNTNAKLFDTNRDDIELTLDDQILSQPILPPSPPPVDNHFPSAQSSSDERANINGIRGRRVFAVPLRISEAAIDIQQSSKQEIIPFESIFEQNRRVDKIIAPRAQYPQMQPIVDTRNDDQKQQLDKLELFTISSSSSQTTVQQQLNDEDVAQITDHMQLDNNNQTLTNTTTVQSTTVLTDSSDTTATESTTDSIDMTTTESTTDQQPSSQSIVDSELDDNCNNEDLRLLIAQGIVKSPTISKQLIYSEARDLLGQSLDVICTMGELDFAIASYLYCKEKHANVTCLAFLPKILESSLLLAR